jgi:hypothetical protein
MPNDLYETDFVRWADHHAALLGTGAVAEAVAKYRGGDR